MSAAKSQYKNQRLFRPGRQRRQQHLLEVSIRRDRERAIWFKSVTLFLLKFVTIVAVVGGLAWGGCEGFMRYLWKNPYFYLTDTHVHTDGTLTREQILVAAGLTEQMNFFQLNMDKVRAALEALPQVEHVDLGRTLPNRVNIDVSERQPIAWLTALPEVDPTAADKAFLVDSRGYVMTSRKRRLDFMHLPIVSGVVLEDFCAGQKVNSLEIQSALELIRLNADSTRWQVRNVDISKGYCLIVTDRGRSKVTFGLDDMDRQLTRLYRILDYLESDHREIQTVNLLVERNTPVTFADETEAVPVVMPAPVEVKPPEKVLLKSTPRQPGFSKPDEKPRATPAPPVNIRRAQPVVEKKEPKGGLKKPFRSHG